MALRILIIRFSSIGDIVLTTPVMRCLKKQYPDCHIAYATKKSFAGILEANPYVDKVYKLENSIKDLKSELEVQAFDYIIDLHKNIRSKRLSRGLQGIYKSFPKLNLEKWLLVNLKINRMPDIHIVDRYLSAASELGIQNDQEGLDYFIPESTTLPELPSSPFIAIAIGGAHNTKRMPVAKFKEVISKLNMPVVLLGGKEDKADADEIQAGFPDKIFANYCGSISLDQSALVLTRSVGIATHDTGMMHIAAALDIPIISIWGNTVPDFGMYAYYPANSSAREKAALFEVKGLKCRPCSKIGYDKCPKGHFDCMNKQDTALIAQTLNRLV